MPTPDLSAAPMIHRRARELRRHLSPPEVVLWTALRLRPGELKWRRQHPLGPYICDFYNIERRVDVEVDGASHLEAEQAAHDLRRDEALARRGVRVLRVPARSVMHDLDRVVAWITARALS